MATEAHGNTRKKILLLMSDVAWKTGIGFSTCGFLYRRSFWYAEAGRRFILAEHLRMRRHAKE